jgi:hypothetical protein
MQEDTMRRLLPYFGFLPLLLLLACLSPEVARADWDPQRIDLASEIMQTGLASVVVGLILGGLFGPRWRFEQLRIERIYRSTD